MTFAIEFEREDDGRWIAEIGELPGVMVYGATQLEAKSRVEALALRVLADRIKTESLDIGTISSQQHEPLACHASVEGLPRAAAYRLEGR